MYPFTPAEREFSASSDTLWPCGASGFWFIDTNSFIWRPADDLNGVDWFLASESKPSISCAKDAECGILKNPVVN